MSPIDVKIYSGRSRTTNKPITQFTLGVEGIDGGEVANLFYTTHQGERRAGPTLVGNSEGGEILDSYPFGKVELYKEPPIIRNRRIVLALPDQVVVVSRTRTDIKG